MPIRRAAASQRSEAGMSAHHMASPIAAWLLQRDLPGQPTGVALTLSKGGEYEMKEIARRKHHATQG
jgi:hypothetical protein